MINNNDRSVESVLTRSANKKIYKRNIIIAMAFFTVSFFWQEMFTRMFTFSGMTFYQFLLISLKCISFGMFFSLIISFITNKKALHITVGIISAVISVVFSAQIVYFKVFRQYFAWDTVSAAGQLKDYISEALLAILKSLPKIIVIFVPVILFLIFKKRFFRYKKVPTYQKIRIAIAFVLALLLGLLFRTFNSSARKAYFDGDVNIISQYFGVLTSSEKGIRSTIFGGGSPDYPDDETVDIGSIIVPGSLDTSENTDETGGDTSADEESSSDETTGPIEYGDNVLDIDFDALIEKNSKNDNIVYDLKYFKSQIPTKKNEYTGYFKGKNLVFISLESFCGEFISEQLTPTLYMMANSGFVFNNFYNSCWGGSTSTGEYANLTGLFYNSASCFTNTKLSASDEFPFALGNQFLKLGYNTYAFHANTASYYKRTEVYPKLGYQYYYGRGGTTILDTKTGDVTLLDTGIETFKSATCDGWSMKSGGTKPLWPESDHELAMLTTETYLDQYKKDGKPFHVYYMSISGHCNYSWSGNAMCKKHKDEVQNLGYKLDEVKAYVACQLEVELMMKQLVDDFRKAGVLDDTVFVLCADHFPYEMEDESLAELYGLPQEGITKNYDLYKNKLIIWCSDMKKTVTVDVPCSAIDILPTVSNLFGLEYDSRLLAGTDILSGTDPIVIMNCVSGPYWGWITKYGYKKNSSFTAFDGFDWTGTSKSDYSKSVTSVVNAKYKTFITKGAVLKDNFYSFLNIG